MQDEGYIAEDSAGQTNMYPTIMKPYAAGSDSDSTSSSAADTNSAAVIAGTVAAGLVFAGLMLGSK